MGLEAGDANLYRYVSNNPVKYVDPLGLTQEDIDLAFKYVREMYPDSTNVSYRTEVNGELNGSAGRYDPYQNEVIVSSNYLNDLSSQQAADLLDTAFHEIGHSQNLLKILGDVLTPGTGKDDYFHKQIYDQAVFDTAESIKPYLNERKGNICQ